MQMGRSIHTNSTITITMHPRRTTLLPRYHEYIHARLEEV